ncbi:hypothetical protein SBDP1_250041 [Syntrophobacter sp. SbD1]|nr:hypothetical protein SBDP1_250041 [Syntrophobacter sp. SbD1]
MPETNDSKAGQGQWDRRPDSPIKPSVAERKIPPTELEQFFTKLGFPRQLASDMLFDANSGDVLCKWDCGMGFHVVTGEVES